MTLKEMRAARARIIANARAKFDEITDTTAEARGAEINREFDAMMIEAETIGAQITRAERLAGAESTLEERDSRVPGRPDEIAPAVAPQAAAIDYRTAFAHLMLSGGDVHNMAPEHRAALMARRVGSEQRAQTTVAAAGGYTIPTELQNELVKAMAAWGPMYDSDFARVLNTPTGNPITFPTIDDTANQAALNASEGVALTDDGTADAVLGQKTLGSFMYDTKWVRVSWELDTDSIFSFESLLAELLAERIGRRANQQLTVGTGSGQPEGIVTGSSLGKTSAVNSAFTADEILDLYHSVDPAYRTGPRVGMMFNDATLLSMHKLKDGQGNYLITDAPDGSGRVRVGAVVVPYAINQAMDSVGALAKPMIFGDMGKYWVRRVGTPMIGALQDKDFWPGFGVAAVARLDGGIADSRAIKHMAMPV